MASPSLSPLGFICGHPLSTPSRHVHRLPLRCPRHAQLAMKAEQPARHASTIDLNPDHNSVPLKTPVHFRIPVLGWLLDNLVFNNNDLVLARRYGPVFRTSVVDRNVVAVSDIHAIAEIFRDSKNFKSANAFPEQFKLLIAQNTLTTSDDPLHSTLRGPILPALSTSIIPLYFPTIVSSAHQLWDYTCNNASPDNPLSLKEQFQEHFLRIILSITTAARPAPLTELFQLFQKLVAGMISVPFGPVWRDALKARAQLTEIIKDLIHTRIRDDAPVLERIRQADTSMLDKFSADDVDALMMLIASSEISLSNVDQNQPIIDQLTNGVVELLFAGYFTQATSMVFSTLEMHMDKQLLHDLREEQARIETLTFDAVNKDMPLLSSFISEVLRFYPPVFMWWRTAEKDLRILHHEVRKSETVQLSFWPAQRDPSIFRNPDEFNPRRFLPGTPDSQSPSVLLSFGAVGSSHFCVGAALARTSIRTTLATLLRDYEVEIVPRKSSRLRALPELNPVDGVKATHCRRR